MAKATTCPRCGAATEPGKQFCASCGLSLVEAEKQAFELRQMKQRDRNGREKQWLFFIFLVMMGLAYLYLR
jgi:uncharacterized membrane protein YvbJ